MERMAESPLAVYQAYLDKGELVYQWSPEANRAVFYPRVICPFSGSDRLEWRVSAGLGTVYATTVTHPREGTPYNIALIDLRRGLSADEPGRGHRPRGGQDRHAGQASRPSPRGRRGALPGLRPGSPHPSLPRERGRVREGAGGGAVMESCSAAPPGSSASPNPISAPSPRR